MVYSSMPAVPDYPHLVAYRGPQLNQILGSNFHTQKQMSLLCNLSFVLAVSILKHVMCLFLMWLMLQTQPVFPILQVPFCCALLVALGYNAQCRHPRFGQSVQSASLADKVTENNSFFKGISNIVMPLLSPSYFVLEDKRTKGCISQNNSQKSVYIARHNRQCMQCRHCCSGSIADHCGSERVRPHRQSGQHHPGGRLWCGGRAGHKAGQLSIPFRGQGGAIHRCKFTTVNVSRLSTEEPTRATFILSKDKQQAK